MVVEAAAAAATTMGWLIVLMVALVEVATATEQAAQAAEVAPAVVSREPTAGLVAPREQAGTPTARKGETRSLAKVDMGAGAAPTGRTVVVVAAAAAAPPVVEAVAADVADSPDRPPVVVVEEVVGRTRSETVQGASTACRWLRRADPQAAQR